MALVIAIGVKGLKEGSEKLQRFRGAVLARISAMLEGIGQETLTRSTEDYLSGPRPDKLGRVSGDLARSINYKITGNRVAVGSNLPYAAIHEFGGTIKVKNAPLLVFKTLDGAWRRAKQVTIPARPYLSTALADARDRGAILEIVNKQVLAAKREAFA